MSTNFIKQTCPIRRVGTGDKHHFFGYYNKDVWDKSGRYFLSQQVPMRTADLTGLESAEVGYFDLEDADRFHKIGTTTAWNWQMGSQLQWLGQGEIIYNARAEPGQNGIYADFCAKVYNVETGTERTLPLPVYVVAPNSKYALCVDYARFHITHRTIAYSASEQKPSLAKAPHDDGIHIMDIESGHTKLILSLAELTQFQHRPSMDKAIHWLTHLEINPSSSRFLFIHRWTERVEDETCFLHRLFTMNPDGSDLRLLECSDHALPQLEDSFDSNDVATFDYEKSEYQISHPAWKDDSSVIVWGPHQGEIHYHLYEDIDKAKAEIIGAGTLTENGHMTYSDDGAWILTDTYPDDISNERLLILYKVETNEAYAIGSFYTDPDLGKENRCDLHPRFSPDNQEVCIDSIHETCRQRYIIDVSSIVCR